MKKTCRFFDIQIICSIIAIEKISKSVNYSDDAKIDIMNIFGKNVEKIDGDFYVDGEKTIRPTLDDVIDSFDRYNKLYFGGKLPLPTKFIDYTSGKRVCGQVAYVDGKTYFYMNLRGGVLWTKRLFDGVMLHEMIHFYIVTQHPILKWFTWTHYTSLFLLVYLYLRLRYRVYICLGKQPILTIWDYKEMCNNIL